MQNLSLLVLRCADIETAREFYELFGMTFRRHAHGKGPEHYAHEDARGVFELYPARPGESDRTGLGFLASDLKDMQAKLRAARFDPKEIETTDRGVSFVVRDPDGRRVEVSKK
jgi:hypothetical protein